MSRRRSSRCSSCSVLQLPFLVPHLSSQDNAMFLFFRFGRPRRGQQRDRAWRIFMHEATEEDVTNIGIPGHDSLRDLASLGILSRWPGIGTSRIIGFRLDTTFRGPSISTVLPYRTTSLLLSGERRVFPGTCCQSECQYSSRPSRTMVETYAT